MAKLAGESHEAQAMLAFYVSRPERGSGREPFSRDRHADRASVILLSCLRFYAKLTGGSGVAPLSETGEL